MGVKRDLVLIYGAALLRSFGIGLLGVLLGIYLFHDGASSAEIGLVIATGLAGGAVATAMVSLRGDCFGRRRSLTVLALLSTVGGLGLLLDGSHCGIRVGTGHYSGTGFRRTENMDTLLVQPGSGQWTCTGSAGRGHSIHFAAVVRN